MATVTLLGTTFNTNTGTKTVVATPAIGSLIVIVTAHTASTTSVAPTDNNTSGAGTYSLPTTNGSATKAASADTMRVYVRNSFITTASSTTFTHAPGGTTTGGGLSVYQVTGMSKVGTAAIRQAAQVSNVAGGATPTPTFAVAALTTNPVLGFNFNTSTAGMTPRTGYTERADVNYSTPVAGLHVMTRDTGETATAIAWGSTSTAHGSIALELDASANAKASTLTANFDTNTLPATFTDGTGGNLSFAGGKLIITGDTFSTYRPVISLNKYDLSGDSYFLEMTPSEWTQVSRQTLMVAEMDANNQISWNIGNGNIEAISKVGTVSTTVAFTPYIQATHKWFRFREVAGTLYWDYSTDGTTWTNFTSQATPFPLLSVNILMMLGNWQFEATGATATFDNFNVAPGGVVATGQIKVYSGATFVAKPVKVWNGTAWVVKPLKRWNGTSWTITPY